MMKDDWTWRYPRHVAHRGGGTLAPENTLAAMRVGRQYGYRMAECDAKLSGDGTLVLMHDDTVDRTTSGSGRVAGLTWGELARLDAGRQRAAAQPDFVGEPVPTLEALVRWCLATGHAINVEIKPCPGRERETGAAVAIALKHLWTHDGLPPLISSFSEVALATTQEFAPGLPRALLQHHLTPDWADRLARLDCVALDAHYKELSREVVEKAHALGYRVACYTPNEPEDVARLFGWGVDTVITDALDRNRPDA